MSSPPLPGRITAGFYPERQDQPESMFSQVLNDLAHTVARRFQDRPARFQAIVPMTNTLRPEFSTMSEQDFKTEADALRLDLRRQGMTAPPVARAFALIREVAARRLGTPHYDTQLMGGWVMVQGFVAEMETGEGKTLTATLPACTAALAGVPVHIVTVNDYLAKRDAAWMGPIYETLGLTVGIVVQGMSLETRRQAYACDVTYCTNKELVFDYLKDRLLLGQKPGPVTLRLDRLRGVGRLDNLCLRGLFFAIVDEADSILIDEARTPLIISGAGSNSYEAKIYQDALQFATQMETGRDFTLDFAKRSCELTEEGSHRLAEMSQAAGSFWAGRNRRQEIIRQALCACHLFQRDREYLLRDGKIEIIDEYTGRTMADRSWERGLHQLIEAKESCAVTTQRETMARISYQRFFRRYRWLAGMTGTAREVTDELWSVYRLPVVRVPPNRPVIRQERPALLFPDAAAKWAALLARIREIHDQGRPILIGTRSVATSEYLHGLLNEAGLPHRVLNARQDEEEAEIISQAGQQGQITVATNMAGRGTDIILGQGVRELGGLHVISTERHTARRIDRQLFGRCGRQGDPGSYELVAALDDEIFLAALPPGWRMRLQKIAAANTAISRFVAEKSATFTQWQVERRDFLVRRDLMRFDDSLADALAFSGAGE
ncbi:MAG: hypothetical protein A2521_00400 [Deltaproteobacteria bacterium RIFOXYD12_FULL_57_12]|nr:MAG: hypothetical protein A2521_00400 [Deltaproteobacteria bacterium RIFOXYD12_FULL_57_12]